MTAGPPRRRPLLRAHEDTRAEGDRAALERLTAFSDAVVAIAITLIVLPLTTRPSAHWLLHDPSITMPLERERVPGDVPSAPVMSIAITLPAIVWFWP